MRTLKLFAYADKHDDGVKMEIHWRMKGNKKPRRVVDYPLEIIAIS
jgi:hypothetical protein